MASRMRTCTNCGRTARPHDAFYRKRDGWDSWCKPCRREASRRQYNGGTVDALPTRALLTFLIERGRSLQGIADEVGCTVATLRHVCAGQVRVREVTAQRVRVLVNELAATRSVE